MIRGLIIILCVGFFSISGDVHAMGPKMIAIGTNSANVYSHENLDFISISSSATAAEASLAGNSAMAGDTCLYISHTNNLTGTLTSDYLCYNPGVAAPALSQFLLGISGKPSGINIAMNCNSITTVTNQTANIVKNVYNLNPTSSSGCVLTSVAVRY